MPVSPRAASAADDRARLDVALVARGLAESREKAQSLIVAGLVAVDGRPARKVAERVAPDAELTVESREGFVSRGGEKLERALATFEIDVDGLVCLDAGASTGGFTDVLLRRGARRVYAVDVGHGQLDWRLRNDPRVVVDGAHQRPHPDRRYLSPSTSPSRMSRSSRCGWCCRPSADWPGPARPSSRWSSRSSRPAGIRCRVAGSCATRPSIGACCSTSGPGHWRTA